MCFFRSLAKDDIKLHGQHLIHLSALCSHMCELKSLLFGNISYKKRICKAFPQCVFSNASSKGLPQRMQSYTGCICLFVLRGVFSYVSSNGLPERMHNDIGCICLAFLHCVFSNVSSNRLPEKKHSHIGCICLTS